MVDLKDFNLSPEASKQFLESVEAKSAVQELTTYQRLPGNGQSVPVLGKLTAEFTARGAQKRVENPTIETKTITPHTIAVVVPVDNDQLEDFANLEAEIVQKGSEAIAEKFDAVVVDGTAPGSGFHTFKNADSVTVTDRASFIAALAEVSTGKYSAEGFVLSKKLYFALLGATNDSGAPVFNVVGDLNRGSIEGIPYVTFNSSDEIGVLGAFKSGAVWGSVSGIHIKSSESATYTDPSTNELVSAFDTNRTVFRVEARVGFQVIDEDAFVKVDADEEDNS